ncbi:MAG: FAD-dependent oxidoreductase [Gammaproteobacteria bacterium]|nr:FAD-dependent oxidoreductase [Gammaproteobacteria bacterium]
MTRPRKPDGITRRRFVNGVAVGVAGTVAGAPLPFASEASAPRRVIRSGAPLSYSASLAGFPPLRGGLRGSHEGANEVAHQMPFDGRSDWGPAAEPDLDLYDLVVVGGGISGLAAAHFYRKAHPDARILILENHDDIGGHARRNEFHLDGRLYLSGGGSRYLMPAVLADHLGEVYKDLGIDYDQITDEAADYEFYARHGLGIVFYFDAATYGERKLLPGHFGVLNHMDVPERPSWETISQMPFSEKAKRQLYKLYHINEDRTEAGFFDELDYLGTLTYEEFLKKHGGITEPEILDWIRPMSVLSGMWNDSLPAWEGFAMGQPGLGATSFRLLRGNRYANLMKFLLSPAPLPDGNGGLARLFARSLVPQVSSGALNPAGMVAAPFDYGKLDEPGSQVRIRLNSTAVQIAHDGDPQTAKQVFVTYVRHGKTEKVRARNCVLACWNNMIPHIWREIPDAQRSALAKGIKLPNVFTNVLLRNWRAFERAGVGGGFASSFYHSTFYLENLSNLGNYHSPANPEEPTILFLAGCPRGWGPPDVRNRSSTGRYELMGTTFEFLENDIKEQFNGMLGDHGFDADRDMAAITVNLWPHGYTAPQSTVFDPPYAEGEEPHLVGRRKLGRVAIANSDASTVALITAAVDEAKRAIDELEEG